MTHHNRVEGKASVAPETFEDLPIPILGKSYPTYGVTDCLVKIPTLLLACFLFIPLVLTILSLSVESELDTRPGTFSIADHPSAQQQWTMDNALQTWEGSLDAHYAGARAFRPGSDKMNVATRFFISYEVDAAAATAFMKKYGLENQTAIEINRRLNLLDINNIQYIRDFEYGLTQIPNYRDYCWSARFRGGPTDANQGVTFSDCTPPNSAMTWFYPGIFKNSTTIGGYWSFDLTNDLQTPIDKVSNLFFQSSSYRWFVDQTATPENQVTFLLRSQFQLGTPLVTASTTDQDQLIDDFLVKVIEYLDSPPYHPFIRINYGGDRIEQALAGSLADGDTTRVFMGLLILFPVLWYYFHSFILAVLSIIQLAITYPAGFFIFVSARGDDSTAKLSLLTALSYLVTLVMAANGMMIIFDTFRQSGFMPTTGRRNLLTVGQRIAYTYRKAGTGISVASIITVACFLANLSSKVPAISSFSGMAAVFVVFNWFMLMTYFPAAMLFHHFHISRRRRNLQKQKEVLIERGLRIRDPTFAKFNADVEALNEKHNHPTFSYLQSSAAVSEQIRKREKNNPGGFFGRHDNSGNHGSPVRNADGEIIISGDPNHQDQQDRMNASGAGVEGGLFSDTPNFNNNNNNNNNNDESIAESFANAAIGFFKSLGVTDMAQFFRFSEAEEKDKQSKQKKNYNPNDVTHIQVENKRMVAAVGKKNEHEQSMVLVPQSEAFEVDEDQFLNLFSDSPGGAGDNNDDSDGQQRQQQQKQISARYKALWQTALLHDSMRISLDQVVEIRFINCDEMLAFDDADLRERLIHLGHNDFANFNFDETDDVAPLCGIVPQFRKQVPRERIHTMVGVALPLLYGKGRTLMSLNLDQLRVAQKSKKKSAEDRDWKNKQENQVEGRRNDQTNNEEEDQQQQEGIYDSDRVVQVEDEHGRTVTMRRKAPPGEEEMNATDGNNNNNRMNRYKAAAASSSNQNQDCAEPPHAPPKRPKAPQASPASPASPAGAGPPPPGTRPRAQNPLKQMLGRAGDWWRGRKDVQREYCCGWLGKRIDETPQERQRRILAKTIKHEGYTFWERLFYNEISDFYNIFRFIGILLLIALLIIGIILSSDLPFSSNPPEFLGIKPTERYDQISSVFGESGNCDYCSAYFQPFSAFPRPSSTAVAACTNAFSQPRYFLEVDQCGKCGTENACLDCQGIPSGPNRFDSCGQCLEPTHPLFGKCAFCINSESMDCSYCQQKYTGPPAAADSAAGDQCQTVCNVFNCIHGECNPFTGKCDCHRTSKLGYWATSPGSSVQCTVCLENWGGLQCTLDCAQSEGACSCIFGRCGGCDWGFAGENCNLRREDLCSITGGEVDSATQKCNCNSGRAGPTCKGDATCSGHGVIYNAPSVPAALDGKCGCFGQWRGPQCDYCRCYNGGTCDEVTGECICKSGWSGDHCQQCADTCKTRGHCSEPYNISQYDYRTCRALFCSDDELATGKNTTTDCSVCWTYSQNPECDNSGTSCLASENCVESGNNVNPNDHSDVNGTLGCRKNYKPDQELNHDCHCRGQWYSASCSICNTTPANNARGVSCRESDGVLLGCDGNPQTLGRWTTLDSCNTCGGTSSSGATCSGCDGIIGSDKVVDQCGVCGGFNDCLAGQLNGGNNIGGNNGQFGASSATTLVQPQSLVKFSFGLRIVETGTKEIVLDDRFDFASSIAQVRLRWICEQFLAETSVVRVSQSRCFVSDFRQWLLSKNLPFPYPNGDFHKKVYEFAEQNGRFGEVAFNTFDKNATNLKTNWILIELRPVRLYDDDPQEYLEQQYEFWQRVLRNINVAGTEVAGECLMSSSAFVALFSLRAAKLGTIYTIVLGCGLFVTLILTVTCSFLLSFCSLLVLVANVLFVLGMFSVTGWEMGPIEQVSIALLLGVVSERSVHICESYMEYLQRIHSHWFAQEATRLQAVKNMMQRVGVSLSCSSLTLVIGTCIALSANLFVIRRIAVVVLIVIASQFIFSLILLPMLLLCIGPVTNQVSPRLMFFFFTIGVILFVCIFVPASATGAIALI